MKKILFAVFALSLALGSSMPVSAAQTTTMPVSVTLTTAVTVSATSLDFGSIPAIAGTILNGTATITVNAPSGAYYIVTLDAGLHYNGTSRSVMSGTTSAGSYDLYKDTVQSAQWGDSGYANTMLWGTGVVGTGSGANQTLTVYGQIMTYERPPGTYTDTVTVTVNY